ncbi:hypothetical protein GCM10009816_25870 [Microbacterium aquimaris]
MTSSSIPSATAKAPATGPTTPPSADPLSPAASTNRPERALSWRNRPFLPRRKGRVGVKGVGRRERVGGGRCQDALAEDFFFFDDAREG